MTSAGKNFYRGVLSGTIATEMVIGVGGCAIGAGLGGALGAAVTKSLAGAEVAAAGGCGSVAGEAMYAALPSAVFLGSINGGLDFLHAKNEANQQLQEDLLACGN